MKIYNVEKQRKITEDEAQAETQNLKDEITEIRIRIENHEAEMKSLRERTGI